MPKQEVWCPTYYYLGLNECCVNSQEAMPHFFCVKLFSCLIGHLDWFYMANQPYQITWSDPSKARLLMDSCYKCKVFVINLFVINDIKQAIKISVPLLFCRLVACYIYNLSTLMYGLHMLKRGLFALYLHIQPCYVLK